MDLARCAGSRCGATRIRAPFARRELILAERVLDARELLALTLEEAFCTKAIDQKLDA